MGLTLHTLWYFLRAFSRSSQGAYYLYILSLVFSSIRGSFVLLYSTRLLSCISSICWLSTIVLGIVVDYMLYVYVYAGGRLEDPFYSVLCIWVYTLLYIGILLFCMFLVGIVIYVCIVM